MSETIALPESELILPPGVKPIPQDEVEAQPEQVKAMKDAGFLDDPEKRQKMVRRYAQEAKMQRK